MNELVVGLLGLVVLLVPIFGGDALLVWLTERNPDGTIDPSRRAVEAAPHADTPPARSASVGAEALGSAPTDALTSTVRAASRAALTVDCPHANTMNHVTKKGIEMVAWTTCDDCDAITASSRRSKYGKPR